MPKYLEPSLVKTLENRSCPRVAVIGGGPAGAMAARTLSDRGLEVTVYDKARGPGGRASTRRGDHGRFDHGAQYLTASDLRIRELVHAWEKAGIIGLWEGRIGQIVDGQFTDREPCTHWVGTPKMSRLAAHLLEDLDTRFSTCVTAISRASDGWSLSDDNGVTHGLFDHILIAAPPTQAASILSSAAPALAEKAKNVDMLPCWALMLSLDERLELPFDAVKVRDESVIGWAARDSSKPGRSASPSESWVIHAGNEWSRCKIELGKDAARDVLLASFKAFCKRLRVEVPRVLHAEAHRWRYARTGKPLGEPCMHEPGLGITVCGDWLLGDKIESALLSGLAAADRIGAPVV